MPESDLHQSQISGFFVEMNSEGVPQAVKAFAARTVEVPNLIKPLIADIENRLDGAL